MNKEELEELIRLIKSKDFESMFLGLKMCYTYHIPKDVVSVRYIKYSNTIMIKTQMNGKMAVEYLVDNPKNISIHTRVIEPEQFKSIIELINYEDEVN